MSFWAELAMPSEHELLIGFYDLTGYTRHAEKSRAIELLTMMAEYFAITGKIIEDAGGRLVKTLGDAGLAAFPSESVDAGVLALRDVQRTGDAWLARRGYNSRAIVKLHLGPVAIGLVGCCGREIIDVYGSTVNFAAVLNSSGLAMTPAVFRRLTPETRMLFKKHTPPITYIGAEDHRP